MDRRSRLSIRDLVGEATSGILQRPGRSVLTMLGTVLGIGAMVAILGLTTTAGGQIDRRFTALAATEVTVEDVGANEVNHEMSFPADADSRIRKINGVVRGGLLWPLPLRKATVSGVPELGGDSGGWPSTRPNRTRSPRCIRSSRAGASSTRSTLPEGSGWRYWDRGPLVASGSPASTPILRCSSTVRRTR